MTLKEIMNRYKIVEKIKRGGQKAVYKATAYDGSVFALKIVDSVTDQRVIQEIEIVKNLKNEHVPVVFENGIAFDETIGEESFYIIEEYIDGQTLRDSLLSGKKLTLREAYELLYTLLEIEIQLEEQGILHRDINPNNIIIGNNDKIYLIDFGIAKDLNGSSLTMASATHGPFTPGYAPYEQFANLRQTQDVRTDLFQIGVTIYEACKGEHPFVKTNETPFQIMSRTLTIIPRPLMLEGDTKGMFSKFIEMLMAKNQSQRPENAKTAMKYLKIIKSTLSLEGDK